MIKVKKQQTLPPLDSTSPVMNKNELAKIFQAEQLLIEQLLIETKELQAEIKQKSLRMNELIEEFEMKRVGLAAINKKINRF